jgi:hypothetical protein
MFSRSKRQFSLGVLALSVCIASCEGGATVGSGPNAVSSGAPGTSASSAPGSSASPGTGPHASASPNPGTSASATPGSVATATPNAAITNNPIKHVVIIIQENRSFDNLFHGFSEPSGAMADYANYGYDKMGNQIPLQQVTFETYYGPSHGHADF